MGWVDGQIRSDARDAQGGFLAPPVRGLTEAQEREELRQRVPRFLNHFAFFFSFDRLLRVLGINRLFLFRLFKLFLSPVTSLIERLIHVQLELVTGRFPAVVMWTGGGKGHTTYHHHIIHSLRNVSLYLSNRYISTCLPYVMLPASQ